MRWKSILFITALVVVALIAGVYAFLSLYDFNRFKPNIERALKEATGRELTIDGNIDFEFGITPTLVVEGVSLQNPSWASRPQLWCCQPLTRLFLSCRMFNESIPAC